MNNNYYYIHTFQESVHVDGSCGLPHQRGFRPLIVNIIINITLKYRLQALERLNNQHWCKGLVLIRPLIYTPEIYLAAYIIFSWKGLRII